MQNIFDRIYVQWVQIESMGQKILALFAEGGIVRGPRTGVARVTWRRYYVGA